MPRTGALVSAITGDMTTVAPAPAPAPAHDHQRTATRPAKRMLEWQDAVSNPLPSKRARRSIGAGVDASRRLLLRCRGGAARQSGAAVESDDKGGEESPVIPAQDPAAQTDESEPTSSSQKTAENTTGSEEEKGESTSSSLKPGEETAGNDDDDSSGPASSPHKPVNETNGSTEDDSGGPASSPHKPVNETNGSTGDDSSGPASSPCKPVNGTDGSTDETTESAESTEKVETSQKASKKSTRVTEEGPRNISGLLNNSNQCFANSQLQLIDAALDGHDVDMVLGKPGSTAPFRDPMLKHDDRYHVPMTRGRSKGNAASKKPESKLSRVKTSIGNQIKKVRRDGKLKALSVRKHLRALIHRLRQHKGKGQSELVSPFVFQQILAYGDENASREYLDGDSQEDCFDYFGAIMAGLENEITTDSSDDESTETPSIVNGMFRIETETASQCSNESCDHKGDAAFETMDAHILNVGSKKESVVDLLEKSNVSPMDDKCPKCGEQTLERVTEFTEVADNFVVHLNRVDYSRDRKIKTAVVLPLEPIELCGKEYALNAVIKHMGDSVHAGHYTIFRKRNPNWNTEYKSLWYHFDDRQVSAVKTSEIMDPGNGQSAMLLFKAL